jgi:hypothetical protein
MRSDDLMRFDERTPSVAWALGLACGTYRVPTGEPQAMEYVLSALSDIALLGFGYVLVFVCERATPAHRSTLQYLSSGYGL